jgi:hypothetical protein
MDERTILTLKRLEEAAWFSAAGQFVDGPVIVLSSWKEAVEACRSSSYQDLCLEAANRYRERLVERSVERFRLWNQTVRVVKQKSVPLVKRKIREVVETHKLPKVFEDTVQWDTLMVCMEAEFADIYPPGFFASQAYWYVEGHFPCGWKGDFPNGRQIIY